MHHFAAAVPVREVEGDHIHPGEGVPESAHRRRVRPVADADEQRLLVEPDRVAALDHRRLGELGCDRNAGRGKRSRDRIRLAAASDLPRP